MRRQSRHLAAHRARAGPASEDIRDNVPEQAQQPVVDASKETGHLQQQLLATGSSGRPSFTKDKDQSFSGSTKSFNRAIGNLSFIVVVAIQ